jgi:hypothetical protein
LCTIAFLIQWISLINAFNLLEKKTMDVNYCSYVFEKRGVMKKNGRGKKVKNEGMKLWRERNRKREEEK